MKQFCLFFFFLFFFFFANSQIYHGQLVDVKNKPIPYASIFISVTNKGTTTNEYGKFSIAINAKDTDTVSIVCLGYVSIKLSVQDIFKLNSTIILQEAKNTLDEVVVNSVNLDKFLENAIYTFNENFQSNQESDLYLRTYQKKKDDYIGFAEAKGVQFISNCIIDNNPKIRISSWQTYQHVRLYGFANNEFYPLKPQVDFLPFVNNHLKHMMPYESNLYTKEIIDEYKQDDERIWVIEMKPLEENSKRLNLLDKKVSYYLDYFNITKLYYVTVKTKRIIGIDIIVDKLESRRKNSQRKYLNRKEVVRFKYINNKCFLAYAKQFVEIDRIENSERQPIEEVLELYYDNFRVANYTLNSLMHFYSLRDVKQDGSKFYSGAPSIYCTKHPLPCFPGVGKVNDTVFWSKQTLPPFDYETMQKTILK